MVNVTPEIADTAFFWSNVLLIVGALIVLLGTMGAYWSTRYRDRFADERVTAYESAAATAKAETARSLVEQERLKLEQEKLRAEMAWRRVTPAQAAQLQAAMKDCSIKFWLTRVKTDPEAAVFYEDIAAVLKASGVQTQGFTGYTSGVGLTVGGGTAGERQCLLQAFHAAGLPMEDIGDHGFGGKGELDVMVGTKPPPSFQHL